MLGRFDTFDNILRDVYEPVLRDHLNWIITKSRPFIVNEEHWKAHGELMLSMLGEKLTEQGHDLSFEECRQLLLRWLTDKGYRSVEMTSYELGEEGVLEDLIREMGLMRKEPDNVD